jgi:hypothetical protein
MGNALELVIDDLANGGCSARFKATEKITYKLGNELHKAKHVAELLSSLDQLTLYVRG